METNSKEQEARGTESLPKEVLERIENTALAVYPVKRLNTSAGIDLNEYSRGIWIAGATCEALRAREESKLLRELLRDVETFTHRLRFAENEMIRSDAAALNWRISELEAEIINLKA